MRTKVFLVYQGGIANVFRVSCLNLSDFGRDAERLYQGDFYGARMFANGMGAMGAVVRTAYCNKSGDIVHAAWSEDKDAQPFADRLVEVTIN